jgi:adenylylsulfate kinase
MSGVVVWLTGRPASGKSTLAARAAAMLRERHLPTAVLDGDAVRSAMMPQVGYDEAAREAFYAALGRLAALLAQQGLCVLVPATAHLRRFRDAARAIAPRFVEVYVDVSVEECAGRDAKALYAAARSGNAPSLPGVGAPYEPPPAPDVLARGGADAAAAERIVALVS